MIQINLIPDVKSEHIKAVRQKKLITSTALITSGVFLAIVLLLAIAVFGVQKNRISSLSGDIEDKIGQLKSVEDLDKVLTIQNQLSALPELYDQKPDANNMFLYLSVITPTNVKLSSSQVGFASNSEESDGVANMEVTGSTGLFKDVNRYADIIKNAEFKLTDTASGETITGKAFSSVVVESITKNESSDSAANRTSFTISMQYNPEIFNIKYDKVVLTVPNITSSVSSTEKPKFNPEPFDEEGGE